MARVTMSGRAAPPANLQRSAALLAASRPTCTRAQYPDRVNWSAGLLGSLHIGTGTGLSPESHPIGTGTQHAPNCTLGAMRDLMR